MELLKEYQMSIMLVLSGICGMVAFFVFLTNTISAKRKCALLMMEIGATVLLVADRFAYLYRGQTTDRAYWMVRICNFLVYFLIGIPWWHMIGMWH